MFMHSGICNQEISLSPNIIHTKYMSILFTEGDGTTDRLSVAENHRPACEPAALNHMTALSSRKK